MFYNSDQFGADARFGNDGLTQLLLHFDGSDGGTAFIDSSPANRTVTRVGTSTTSVTQVKFGPTSMASSSGGVSVADAASLEVGSGDWTFEARVYPTSAIAASVYTLVYKGDGTTSFFSPFGIYAVNSASTTDWVFAISSTGSSWIVSSVSMGTNSYQTNQWTHLALVRSGSTVYPFTNGVLGTTQSIGAGALFDNTIALSVSGRGGADFMPGYIDECRFSVGIARWTANFTPPPMPYGL